MTNFSLIDPVLSEWALRRSLVWLTDYKGFEVRTFYLNEQSREKIQIWVDAPQDDKTVVHVVQYRIGGKKKNSEDIQCMISDLQSALDKAIYLSEKWSKIL